MNNTLKFASLFALGLAASQAGFAQATITGPSSWVAGQPTTVTWTGSSAPVCASGVRVTLNLGSTKIQTGTPVPMSAGKASIPGATLSAGTAVSLSLTDMCSGKVVSNVRPVSITGSTAAVVPVASTPAITITPQITQNIDTACLGVLGAACSTSASYSSTYTAITQQIKQGTLKSDSSSVMYSYLIPMVQASASWKANVVETAWRGAGCSGTAPEAQWTPKVAQLQTYQAVMNAMKQQGCAAAAGNVASTAPAPAATQYQTRVQLAPAYSQVWGAAASNATFMTNCPVTTPAVTCARSDLAAYVKTHPTVLQTIEGPAYVSITNQTLDNAHGQTLSNAYGRNWTGADDLKTYIQANPALFPPSRIFGGLSPEGCLIDNIRIKLDINEPCGMYFLDASGAHAPGSYPASFQGARFTLSQAGGGVLVDNSGVPLQIVLTSTHWAMGHNIVAQGGGNIVAQGGGNIVAQGGGNIVAQGGGNIVAQGGGNIILNGGGNLIEDGAAYLKALSFTDPLSAARTSRLVTSGGASVISNDGGSFLPSIKQIPAIAGIIGENSSGITNAVNGGVISAKPGAALGNAMPNNQVATSSALAAKTNPGIIGENSSGIISQDGNGLLTDNGAAARTYSAQSLAAASVAVMTGPSTWVYGQPVMVTWKPSPNAPPCAAGYTVLINGTKQVGNPSALVLGKSLLPANAWTRGTVSVSLYSLCTKAPATAPVTMTIQ